MTPAERFALLAGFVLLASAVGLTWRLRTGLVRSTKGRVKVDLSDFGITKAGKSPTGFGQRVTFVQLSSQFCSQCPPTARYLSDLAAKTKGAIHYEFDITDRLDLAKKFGVLQTPTTLVVDRNGFVKSRIGGTPNKQSVIDEIGNYQI